MGIPSNWYGVKFLLVLGGTIVAASAAVMLSPSSFVTLAMWLVVEVGAIALFGLLDDVVSLRPLTDPSSLLFMHCWHTNDPDLSTYRFISLLREPSHWALDYNPPIKQKVQSFAGIDSDAGKYYNYCVAPLRYTGIAPDCLINLWAVCYVETLGSGASFCNETAAKECGWDKLPGLTMLRIIHDKSQYRQRGFESEEIEAYKLAVMKATIPDKMQIATLVSFDDYAPWEYAVFLEDSMKLCQVAVLIMIGVTVLLWGLRGLFRGIVRWWFRHRKTE